MKELIGLTDAPRPMFCLNIGNPEPFTEEEKKTAEECELNDLNTNREG